MKLADWNIEKMTGYKPLTTFYTDFSIADHFGVKAIKDTYNRCKKYWCDDYKYLTELVMVMSWKSFEHQNNLELCKLYSELYCELDEFAYNKFQDNEEQLRYYLRTTD
jgi:hypothetical protein